MSGIGGTNPHTFVQPEEGDDVVISGISGRFPESDDVRRLGKNLFNKIDLVTDDGRRWKLDHPEIPQRTGKINDIEKFDASFFGVHLKQGHTMDPMSRMLLEHAYEAVVDAGVSPQQIRGTKTGVFVGACFSESEETWFDETLQVDGFGITECSRAMLSNRVSYWLGVNGPSHTIDSACSSGLCAIEHAYKAINGGLCDAALVGSSNLCLQPHVSLQFSRLGVLAPDGRCKSYDADANGYARSEAVAMVFLQKAKNAKRIYAQVVHAKQNWSGVKDRSMTFPSCEMQCALFREFYQECGIPPTLMSFMEAYGSGIAVVDLEELNAIDKVFCTGRNSPLLVGSVKSNMGHSEPASGLCSVAKVVVAMESGYIPANLHYNRPRKGAKALEDGRIKIVTESTPWEGGYVGINSFGFGGANTHVLLRSHTKEKINGGIPNDDLPRLVVVSGRTEEAVQTFLDDLESRPVDVEHVRLLHDIYDQDIPGHLYRGYTILPSRGLTQSPKRETQHYPGARRPIWFILSGMGSQWPGMGEALLQFPVFRKAIERCDAALRPHGLDIFDIVTNRDPKIFDNILHSFVGNAAIQIGLVDLLISIGIEPDNIIGHSVGELGCAYADGCLTTEEMILSAYSRGIVSITTETIHGSMAVVGLGYSDLHGLCPPDIYVAFHNGSKSSTIAGPADSMKNFVASLQKMRIFAKEVPCGDIAHHSRYISNLGPKLLAKLKKIIVNPKPRSEKWLSTSIPRDQWTSELAQLSSAEYHTNNLLSSVLFEETSALLPRDAVTIEIAPDGLLQGILRSFHENVINISLTQRNHENSAEFLLEAVGKLYGVGLHPQLKNLYPEVRYPVSRGTPMISPLIRWDYTDDWFVTPFKMNETTSTGQRDVEIRLSGKTFGYMAGHVIDGRILIPATAYVHLIWQTFALMRGEIYTETPVVFEQVKFSRVTTIPRDGSVKLNIIIQKETGRFEIVNDKTAVATGVVRAATNTIEERIDTTKLTKIQEIEDLSANDVYKELRIRGYNYAGVFRGVQKASKTGQTGHIQWANNWAAFMDNMLQMHILSTDSRELLVPTGIQKLVIDPRIHFTSVGSLPEDQKEIPVEIYTNLGVIVSGGIEMRQLKVTSVNRKKPAEKLILEKLEFVSHGDQAQSSLAAIIRLATQIVVENQSDRAIKAIELIEDSQDVIPENLITPLIQEVLSGLSLLQTDVKVIVPAEKHARLVLPDDITVLAIKKLQTEANAQLVVTQGLFARNRMNTLQQLRLIMKDKGFLLAREPLDADVFRTMNNNFDVVLEKRTDRERLILLRRRGEPIAITSVIPINSKEFSWLPKLQADLKAEGARNKNRSERRILLVAQSDFENGISGLINCLRKEPGGECIRGLFIQDASAPNFSLSRPLYSEQLRLDLVHNVLRPRNIWGTYRFSILNPIHPKLVYQAVLNQSTLGDVGSLQWVEGPIRPSLRDENLVKIYYSSLTSRDVMLATEHFESSVVVEEQYPARNVFGFEYAGKNSDGRLVMGIVGNGGLSNLCIPDVNLQWDIPNDWSLEDAATVPVAYVTSYIALYFKGRMKKGDKVLIHDGSDGIGQAAITMALHEGCEVFTTVGSSEKRDFMKQQFPLIDDHHVGNSRDESFERWILRETQNRGVDIVVNSLSEAKLQSSLRCLAHGGRFLELGHVDVEANNPLGMGIFLSEVSIHGINIDSLINASVEQKKRMHSLIEDKIRRGAIKPLVRTVFVEDRVEAAFRYMAAGKHVGKVLIKFREDDEVRENLPHALPRYYCLEDSSYLIHGGLGAFGVELAEWLVLRGAKKLVLTSRKGICNGYQRRRVHLWKSHGVEVLIIVDKDASTEEGCEAILKEAEALGPVDGIFHLAADLGDNSCENQTIQTFEESLRVKAVAAKQFDEMSKMYCAHLRHFVVFSSISSGRGCARLANDGMANSIVEKMCEMRLSTNLPALAIEWGPVREVGIMADTRDCKKIGISGVLLQEIHSCLEELDGFLQQKCAVVASTAVARTKPNNSDSVIVTDVVADIIGLKEMDSVEQNKSLAKLGIDFMMAVDIRCALEREFDIFMTIQEIENLTLVKLRRLSEEVMQYEE